MRAILRLDAVSNYRPLPMHAQYSTIGCHPNLAGNRVQKKRCAYLTMSDKGDYVTDEYLSFEPMAAYDWSVDMVAWQDSSVNWDDYDAVYICTPWDYPQHADKFISVLENIDRSSALLVNDLSLVRWTLSKIYLRDLEKCGVAIVPSAWYEDIDAATIPTFFAALGGDKLVIKPTIGANAMDTFVLTNPVADELAEHLCAIYSERPYFVQPFIENIQHEGEYSLFYFAGEYSHAILKSPEEGDFRVQEEHGADIVSVEPSTDLLEVASQVIAQIDPQPVYVRADFVRGDNNQFLLMELELIEPSLYFRMDDNAAQRFAAAFDEHYRDNQQGVNHDAIR